MQQHWPRTLKQRDQKLKHITAGYVYSLDILKYTLHIPLEILLSQTQCGIPVFIENVYYTQLMT